MDRYKNKRVHVVGASSAEGVAVLRFLAKVSDIKSIVAHDFCEADEFEQSFNRWQSGLAEDRRKELFLEIQKIPERIYFKENYLKDIESAEIIFVPQAWYKYAPNFPKLEEARRVGIPFESMTGLYLELMPGLTVGVTGSQGKTTVSKLIFEIFKQAGRDVYLVGNERSSEQILEKIDVLNKDSVLVMEISNRQLKLALPKKPKIAVITNIYPNHLDEHADFADYAKIKFSIIGEQTKNLILNYDNLLEFFEEYRDNLRHLKKEPVYVSSRTNLPSGIDLKKDGTIENKIGLEINEIGNKQEIVLPGEHNLSNVLLAIAATWKAGIDVKIIWTAVKNFTGASHRLKKILEVDGVSYIDDTKSTTPTATMAAVRAFKKPLTLIVGGDHKNLEFDSLASVITGGVSHLILLPGTVREKLSPFFRDETSVNISEVDSLPEAISLAKKLTEPGGTVLISPAGEKFFTRFLFKDSLKTQLEGVVRSS